ncbi:MAG: hypothetical protein DRN65_00080 [Thaumarchaeota archaeon]|nr:MAG: hypothetical protein DRN65_00080 [Nitrososphaerota archaeon]
MKDARYTKYPHQEMEISGYVVSITPRTRRGLLEYRVKIMTLGGKSETVYMREPEIPLRPGIPIKAKVILSRQSEKPRWIVESAELLKDLKVIDPTLTSIEKITRGTCLIVSGRRDGKMFSIPLQEEDVLEKLPKNLPQDLYCIFIDQGYQIILAEIMRKKEYEIFLKTLNLIAEMEKDESENRKIITRYLKNIQIPHLETVT